MKKLLLALAVVALWTAWITTANTLPSIVEGCNNQTIGYWKSGACYLNDGSGYYTFEKRMESYKIDKKTSETKQVCNSDDGRLQDLIMKLEGLKNSNGLQCIDVLKIESELKKEIENLFIASNIVVDKMSSDVATREVEYPVFHQIETKIVNKWKTKTIIKEVLPRVWAY